MPKNILSILFRRFFTLRWVTSSNFFLDKQKFLSSLDRVQKITIKLVMLNIVNDRPDINAVFDQKLDCFILIINLIFINVNLLIYSVGNW